MTLEFENLKSIDPSSAMALWFYTIEKSLVGKMPSHRDLVTEMSTQYTREAYAENVEQLFIDSQIIPTLISPTTPVVLVRKWNPIEIDVKNKNLLFFSMSRRYSVINVCWDHGINPESVLNKDYVHEQDFLFIQDALNRTQDLAEMKGVGFGVIAKVGWSFDSAVGGLVASEAVLKEKGFVLTTRTACG